MGKHISHHYMLLQFADNRGERHRSVISWVMLRALLVNRCNQGIVLSLRDVAWIVKCKIVETIYGSVLQGTRSFSTRGDVNLMESITGTDGVPRSGKECKFSLVKADSKRVLMVSALLWSIVCGPVGAFNFGTPTLSLRDFLMYPQNLLMPLSWELESSVSRSPMMLDTYLLCARLVADVVALRWDL